MTSGDNEVWSAGSGTWLEALLEGDEGALRRRLREPVYSANRSHTNQAVAATHPEQAVAPPVAGRVILNLLEQGA